MVIGLIFAFLAIFAVFLGLMPIQWDSRPTLNLGASPLSGLEPPEGMKVKKAGPWNDVRLVIGRIAVFNKGIASSEAGQRVYRDMAMSRGGITVEEFFLVKEVIIGVLIIATL